jgi:hypothetical protein
MIFTREWLGSGVVQFEINADDKAANALITRGNIIKVNKDPRKCATITDFELKQDRGTPMLSINAVPGNGFLARRVSVPPTSAQAPGSLGWDRVSAPAETVLKHYADRNIGPGAFDPKRTIVPLVIADDLARGVQTPAQVRYTKLDEDMSAIGRYASMGYEIYGDTANKRWVFDVIPGADRTRGQTDNDPVMLRMDYQNIESYRYVDSSVNLRNTGYALGAGQDENRFTQIIGADNEGAERYEVTLDCGNVNLIDELLYYGGIKLGEFAEARTLEISALPNVFVLGRDYFLGDVITVMIGRLGLILPTRVESVTETWERARGHKVAARFGEKIPNILKILTVRQEVL